MQGIEDEILEDAQQQDDDDGENIGEGEEVEMDFDGDGDEGVRHAPVLGGSRETTTNNSDAIESLAEGGSE